MNRADWHKPTSDDEARRRAGGRARWNAARQWAAVKRRVYCLLPMLRGVEPARGALGGLARRLGVSVATISRDVGSLRRAGMLNGRMTMSQLRVLGKLGGLADDEHDCTLCTEES